jgi:hypothetical protein
VVPLFPGFPVFPGFAVLPVLRVLPPVHPRYILLPPLAKWVGVHINVRPILD